MNRRNLYSTSALAIAALLFCVAAVKGAGPGRPVSTSITVHGHWTLVIRDRDGKVAQRRDFENELDAGGKSLLGGLFRRELSLGSWYVGFGSAATGTYYLKEDNGDCAPFAGAHCFKVLKMTSSDDTTLTLSGTIVPEVTIHIPSVGTAVQVCGEDVAPQACPADGPGFRHWVTMTLLKDAQGLLTTVTVVPGQQLTVTVTLSFS